MGEYVKEHASRQGLPTQVSVQEWSGFVGEGTQEGYPHWNLKGEEEFGRSRVSSAWKNNKQSGVGGV